MIDSSQVQETTKDDESMKSGVWLRNQLSVKDLRSPRINKKKKDEQSKELNLVAELHHEKQSLKRSLCILKTGAVQALAQKEQEIQILRSQYQLTELQKIDRLEEEAELCYDKLEELRRANQEQQLEREEEREAFLKQIYAKQDMIEKWRKEYEELEEVYYEMNNAYKSSISKIHQLEQENLSISIQLELSQSHLEHQHSIHSQTYHQYSKSAEFGNNTQEVVQIKELYQEKLLSLKSKYESIIDAQKNNSLQSQKRLSTISLISLKKKKEQSNTTESKETKQMEFLKTPRCFEQKKLLKSESALVFSNNPESKMKLEKQKFFRSPINIKCVSYKELPRLLVKKEQIQFENMMERMSRRQKFLNSSCIFENELSICPQEFTPRDQVSIRDASKEYEGHKMADEIARCRQISKCKELYSDSAGEYNFDDSKSTIRYLEPPKIKHHRSAAQFKDYDEPPTNICSFNTKTVFFLGLLSGGSVVLILARIFSK